jgi:hypothetical protein
MPGLLRSWGSSAVEVRRQEAAVSTRKKRRCSLFTNPDLLL